ncbi:MAG: ribonuclease J [Thermodesulfobacteriota bacterium]|jgi:ribonuclease J
MKNSSLLTKTPSPLSIVPLGGLGEIGLNMLLVQYEENILVIDAGLMFPEDYMLGIDIVIPDFSFLLKNKEQLRGIVLTHGHEDHIGALPFLLKELSVPVYGSRFTLELVKEKLKEHRILEQCDLRMVAPRESLTIGPFQLEFIRVTHSIPDGLGLAIQTPVGTLIHSGDFKIDQTPLDGVITDINTFAAYGAKGVLALMSDSTNVEREGHTLPEKRISETLDQIMRDCEGRVIVAVFASNINRIQQVVNSASRYQRKVAFNGKSMVINCRIAQELGLLNVPLGMELTLGEMLQLPDSQVTLITTGSQAEPMSSLTRIARDDHKQIKIKKGDTVILSSRFIPGNEKAIDGLINNLYRFGAEVIYEKVSEIHVSGHANQEELKLMLHLTRPKFFIPIHGEYRHLVKHAQLAGKIGIPKENLILAEDGQVIRFDQEGGGICDEVEVGRVFVDGKGVGDVGNLILRDRRHLSNEGLVVVQVVLNNQTGELLSGPDIISRGFISEEEHPELIQEAKDLVLEILYLRQKEDIKNWPDIQEEIRKTLRRFFDHSLERRPVVIPLIIPM